MKLILSPQISIKLTFSYQKLPWIPPNIVPYGRVLSGNHLGSLPCYRAKVPCPQRVVSVAMVANNMASWWQVSCRGFWDVSRSLFVSFFLFYLSNISLSPKQYRYRDIQHIQVDFHMAIRQIYFLNNLMTLLVLLKTDFCFLRVFFKFLFLFVWEIKKKDFIKDFCV